MNLRFRCFTLIHTVIVNDLWIESAHSIRQMDLDRKLRGLNNAVRLTEAIEADLFVWSFSPGYIERLQKVLWWS